MNIKVSVIVPIYNAGNKLYNSLGNLLNQTLQDIEIILVDDCSTDNSPAIEKQCREQFGEKVILLANDRNRGAGGARNLGLTYASGEYIGFMDADDLVTPDMYEKLYDAASAADADIVDSGYYMEEKDLAIIHMSDALTGELDDQKRSELIVSGGYIVTKLFRRTLFEKWDLKFRENAILEDSDFLTKAFAVAQKTANVKEILYKYCFYADSASREQNVELYYKNIYNAMEAIYNGVAPLSGYSGIREAVEYEILQMYDYGIIMCLKAYQKEKDRQIESFLLNLKNLREKIARPGYDNRYVQNKINKADIEIMKRNDISPHKALELLN